MSQAVEELDYAVLGRSIQEEAFRARRPVAGSIALTHRCNLACRHCYLLHSRDTAELSAQAWLDILDQLERAGCLWLLLTGGEPLLFPEFSKVYLGAKQRGMLVSIFTNGTLVDDSIVELLREWPPHVVEISVYGYSRGVYGEVTGAPQLRDACFESIHRLVRAHIPLRLKTMTLRQNVHELAQIRDFSESLGVAFRNDPTISPTLIGTPEPCSARLDHEALVRFDVVDAKRLAGWADFLTARKELPVRTSMFNCAAGMISFAIDPCGLLSLCSYDQPVFDLRQGSFLQGWQGAVKRRRDMALPRSHPCWGCRDQVFCGLCAPVARMETGSELGVPRDVCQQGRERAQAISGQLARAANAICGDNL